MSTSFINFNISRKKLLIVLTLLLLPCFLLNYYIASQDAYRESIIQNSIAELQVKLEYLQSKYISSQEEVHLLIQQLLQVDSSHQLSPDVQLFLNSTTYNTTNVKFPSVYHFLPHFLNDLNSLKPAFIHSKGRTGVSFILGIPHVKREVQSYLMSTLKNIVDRMSPKEVNDTLIVVYVGEIDMDYVMYVTKQIEVQ